MATPYIAFWLARVELVYGSFRFTDQTGNILACLNFFVLIFLTGRFFFENYGIFERRLGYNQTEIQKMV